jgi:ABC-2 type transport system ATP-binding protein
MIEVNKLRKFYGKYRGVIDVGFKIPKGEIYGLIGPNGAGKTTTIRVMLGLLKYDSGSIKIDGYDIPKQLNKIKGDIGYLPGEVNLYGSMKVSEFLKYNRNFYKNIDINYENELCDFLELDKNRKFKELSMGNKKKVGIVQALVHKPKFLILDEPTNGLDPLFQKKLYELVEKERDNGRAILFSSHNLMEVERLSKRVGIIKDGVLVEEMSISELTRYAKKLVTIYKLSDLKPLYKFEHSYKNNGKTTFTIQRKELKEFLSILNTLDYKDMEIRNPSLEETFMGYYTKGGE